MRFVISISILLPFAVGPALGAECDMTLAYTGPAHTAIWKNLGDVPAFYFHSNSDVNTDGSGHSYHPDDIAANLGLAQNTICNGVNRRVGNQTFGCVGHSGACQKCLDHFRSVPKSEMLSHFTTYFESFAIATKDGAACVVAAGDANAGYFVSTTSYSLKDKGICDPDRYLDAMTFPSIAVPKSLINRGVGMGDLVLVRNRKNGRTSMGVVYDSSGSRIGESSIATNRELLCQKNKPGCIPPDNPTTLKESYGLVVEEAEFLIFPGSAGKWPTNPNDVRDAVKQRFESWGGTERLDACASSY